MGIFSGLESYVYRPYQFVSVIGLRTFRRLICAIFRPFKPEVTGKKVQKRRKRGYRDGKGKPVDPSIRQIAEITRDLATIELKKSLDYLDQLRRFYGLRS